MEHLQASVGERRSQALQHSEVELAALLEFDCVMFRYIRLPVLASARKIKF